MPDQHNSQLAEQVFAERYREATEQWNDRQQKRLNRLFKTLGDVDDLSFLLDLQQIEYSSLGEIKRCVNAGDRKAMLALIATTAASLRAFEVLPQDVREAFAEGLDKMRLILEGSHGFLPLKRGKKPEKWIREHSKKEFAAAMAVEYHRYFNGHSLEDAIAKVSEEKVLTESVVHKRWKRRHKDAKAFIASVISVNEMIQEMTGKATPSRLEKKRKS